MRSIVVAEDKVIHYILKMQFRATEEVKQPGNEAPKRRAVIKLDVNECCFTGSNGLVENSLNRLGIVMEIGNGHALTLPVLLPTLLAFWPPRRML